MKLEEYHPSRPLQLFSEFDPGEYVKNILT